MASMQWSIKYGEDEKPYSEEGDAAIRGFQHSSGATMYFAVEIYD